MTPDDKRDQSKAALAKCIKDADENRVLISELYRIQAQRAMDRFRHLKAAGFTDEQALNLCTKEIAL